MKHASAILGSTIFLVVGCFHSPPFGELSFHLPGSVDDTGRIPHGRARSESLVARLTLLFGRFGGLLMSKVIVVVIALGVKRLLSVVNLFYAGVVCWNILVLLILSRS